MAHVEVSPVASAALDALIETHSLPSDTRDRIRETLRYLEDFPRLGKALDGRWRGYRFLQGPWRWFLIVYSYEEEDDFVAVATFEDARSSTSATSLGFRPQSSGSG